MIAKIKVCTNQKEIEAAQQKCNDAVMPDDSAEQQELMKSLRDAIPAPEYGETEFAFDPSGIDWAYPNHAKDAINMEYKGKPIQLLYSDQVWEEIKDSIASRQYM